MWSSFGVDRSNYFGAQVKTKTSERTKMESEGQEPYLRLRNSKFSTMSSSSSTFALMLLDIGFLFFYFFKKKVGRRG
jgi:hypothetical protein